MFGVTKIAALKNLNLKEHKKTRALTFRTVCKAIVGFIRQEKILRFAIGPVNLSQPHKFDLKRLKNYIRRTRAFSAGLSKTKQIEIKAPGSEKKKPMAAKFQEAANKFSVVKKLSSKRGGFIKPSTPQQETEHVESHRSQSDMVPDDPRVSAHRGDRDRRYPSDDGLQERPPPPWAYDPYGRYGPPRDWHPRDEYEYYNRGRESYRQQAWGQRDDYYRRNRDYDWGPERGNGPWGEPGPSQNPQETMEEYRRNFEHTPHGERYKLAPPGYDRPRQYGRDRSMGYSPQDDRYLRLFDSSPEDQRRGQSTKDDYGYYSGPQESREHHNIEFHDDDDDGEMTERDFESQRRGRPGPGQRSPRKDKSRSRKREQHRSLSPTPRSQRQGHETPEEYRWSKEQSYHQFRGQNRGPMMPSRSFDGGYSGYHDNHDHGYDHINPRRGYPSYPNAREEMAKLQSVAVYAKAMGGVNDDEGL